MDQVQLHSAMQDVMVKVVKSTVSRKVAKSCALADLARSSLVRKAVDMLHALEENAVLYVLREELVATTMHVQTARGQLMLTIHLQLAVLE